MANTINNEVDTKDISGSDDEDESEVPKTTYPKDTMTDSKDQEATKVTTLRLQMGSNDVNNTPREYGSAQSIWHKYKWYNWCLEEV